jgi:hypothetical protein
MDGKYVRKKTVTFGVMLFASIAVFTGCRSSTSSLPRMSRFYSPHPAAAFAEPSMPQAPSTPWPDGVSSDPTPSEAMGEATSRTGRSETDVVSEEFESGDVSQNNSFTSGGSVSCGTGCCSH